MLNFTVDRDACIRCGKCVAACPNTLLAMEDGQPQYHMDESCLRCLHCMAACPQKAVHLEGLDGGYPTPQSEYLPHLIQTRRATRRFKPELPREVIQWALDTAQWAPTGKNVRAHTWTVLWGKEVTDRAFALSCDWAEATGKAPDIAEMKHSGRNLLTCGAPCILICHSPDTSPNHTIDATIATTTVELLLNSRGVSTCWGGYFGWMARSVPALREALALPEGHKIRCALLAGYADDDDYPNIPYRAPAQPTWVDTI